MEKNQENKIQELLDRAVELAELAFKCQRLGLIRDFKVCVEIDNQDAYTVKVVINEYARDEMRWCDSTNSYEQDENARKTDVLVTSDTMHDHLKGLLDEEKEKLVELLKIVEG